MRLRALPAGVGRAVRSSSNATSCTASGGWSGSKPTSGSQSYGTVNSTTTYNLSCTNGTTSGSCSATVTVGAAQRYSCSGSSCVPNASGPYTTSNCNNSCSVQRYSCSGSSCVPNASGPYTTSNCNNSCFAGFPVSCSPSTQTVSIGQPATLIAANGNGTYAWSAPGGNPSAGFSSLFQPTYFSQGTYSVMVSSNGTNAFCSVTVSPPASQSDLTITDFHLTDAAGNSKSAFTPTDNIYPSVTIQNNSASPATPSTGYFYISIYSNSPGVVGTGAGSDVSVWAKEAGSIPAFGSKTYSVTSNSANWTNDGSNRINWTKGVGSYTARAFVDSFNYVTEVNESNNQATSNYSVASAPTMATISLSPGNMIFYGLKGLVSNQIVRPTAKTLTISNTGAGTLNWSGTTDQAWCHISAASGSIAPGGSSPVSVTMDDPSNGGIFNCTITISAPNTTNSPQSIVAVYNVTTCGGASPQNDTIPYGTNTRDVTLSNVTNASNVNFPTWSDINGQDDIQWYPGAQTQFAITSACGSASKNYVASAISYGGDTFCASGTPTPVSPAFPNQGESVGWTCQGSAGAWDSTPCSASRQSASCTTLTFRPATSGLSLSNTGPSGTTLNVLPGQTYYAYADYGQVIGYISGPAGCSWENWNGTAARFRCTAPGTPGSYANTTGIFSGGGYCMSGPTTLGRVVVPSTDWKAAINLNNHRPGNPDYGQFYTHVYAYNVGGGSVYCDAANFTRAQQANVTADIKANGSDGPITVSYNQPANITWSSSNATGCSISPGSWTGTTGNQNTPSLVSSVTYTLNCVNGAQTATDSVTINIPPMPSNPVGLCPAPGTTVTASWTPAPGYTHYYFRAYDQANGWNNCTGTDICNEDVVGTSYTFPGIPGHTYSWWVHTRDAATGAYSNAV
ncbi:MAG: GBS Bsp-like repeat-containing protein, partial [Patescibacteria group bacterium]|nr:GBS Bsp-like repeat-containing protein [Patescibacteria group bacterium]